MVPIHGTINASQNDDTHGILTLRLMSLGVIRLKIMGLSIKTQSMMALGITDPS
jgi:hypothetical protein